MKEERNEYTAQQWNLKARLGKRLEILGRVFDLIAFEMDNIEADLVDKEGDFVLRDISGDKIFEQAEAFRRQYHTLFRKTEDLADALKPFSIWVKSVDLIERPITGNVTLTDINTNRKIHYEIAMYALDLMIEDLKDSMKRADKRNDMDIDSKIKLYDICKEEKSKIETLRALVSQYNNTRDVSVPIQYMKELKE